jgi:hypothetical protein
MQNRVKTPSWFDGPSLIEADQYDKGTAKAQLTKEIVIRHTGLRAAPPWSQISRLAYSLVAMPKTSGDTRVMVYHLNQMPKSSLASPLNPEGGR